MPNGASCVHHSGLQTDINNIEKRQDKGDTKMDDICKKLDNLKTWIIGLLGTALLAVVLQITQLIKNGG